MLSKALLAFLPRQSLASKKSREDSIEAQLGISYYCVMSSISINRQFRLTVRDYCIIAAAIMIISSVYSVTNTVNVVDRYISHILLHNSKGKQDRTIDFPFNSMVLSIGILARNANLPFTRSNIEEQDNIAISDFVERLLNERAGMIYLWVFIDSLGIIFLVWLVTSIQRPINRISQAIVRLSNNHLGKPIQVNGPRNIQELSDELEHLRNRLNENDKQQMLFLRHVSHEIKTPLATIKEGATLLNDQLLGAINSDQEEVTSIVHKACSEMQESIENLLTYNSSTSAKSQQKKVLCDLNELLIKTIEKHELTVQRKSINMKLITSPSHAWVDVEQMTTVFDNLLSNAIKYAPPQSEIRIWLSKHKNGSIEFTIRDQGPGVSKEHKSAIFDAFYMGDKSTNATIKGTGIGLSLAKQYVEAHNGRIRLVDTRKGATFKVTIE